MKTSTLVILYAALALAVPGIAVAQSTSVDAAVDATVGATVGADGVGGSVGVDGSANVGADANATDAAGADSAMTNESMTCEELGSAASIENMGKVDPAALSAATKVMVVQVSDCDDTTRSALAGVSGTNIQDALKANAAVDPAIMERGATMADVIGATVSGDTITVYVESNAS